MNTVGARGVHSLYLSRKCRRRDRQRRVLLRAMRAVHTSLQPHGHHCAKSRSACGTTLLTHPVSLARAAIDKVRAAVPAPKRIVSIDDLPTARAAFERLG